MAKYTLVGTDGNAFAILGNVSNWMRNEGFTKAEIDAYVQEATASKDYNKLLSISVKYTDLCNQRAGSTNMVDDMYNEEDTPKYVLPDEDSPEGNAYYILGYVSNAMKTEGFSKDYIADYVSSAMSGDYKNLRKVSQEWLDECNQ